MTRYLLDTNTLSDVIRHPDGRVTEHMRAIGESAVCTSIIVAAELRYGAVLRGSPALTDRVEGILARIEVVSLDAPADIAYAQLRAGLQRSGQPIGGNDLLIAAQAVALGYTVVTDNEREFGRIADLAVENWLHEQT